MWWSKAGNQIAVAHDPYLDLILKVHPLRPIRTPAEHQRAKAALRSLAGRWAAEVAAEFKSVLISIIEAYEREARLQLDTSGVSAAKIVRHLLAERQMSVNAFAKTCRLRRAPYRRCSAASTIGASRPSSPSLISSALIAACFCGEWAEPGSNRRHMDFQSIALPTELPARAIERGILGLPQCKPGLKGSKRLPSRLAGISIPSSRKSSKSLIQILQKTC